MTVANSAVASPAMVLGRTVDRVLAATESGSPMAGPTAGRKRMSVSAGALAIFNSAKRVSKNVLVAPSAK